MDFITPLVAFLAPCVPYLMGLAGKAADKAAEKAGETVVEQLPKAQKFWEKLRPKVEANPIAKAAAEEVAQKPDDAEFQAMLQLALKKLLTDVERNDPKLLAELKDLWEETVATTPATYSVNAQQVYGVAQGENASVTQHFGTPPAS